MANILDNQFDEILEFTAGFTSLIEAQDWIELSRHVDERQKNLDAIFSEEIDERHRSSYLEFIQKIQISDNIHQEKIDHLKNEFRSELNALKTNFHAIKAYKDIHE